MAITRNGILERKDSQHASYSTALFSGKIRCGQCGSFFGAKVWHSNDQYRRTIYRCNRKYGKNGTACTTGHITEDVIKAVFVKAVNQLLDYRETVIKNLDFVKDMLFDTNNLEKELGNLEVEIEITKQLLCKRISSAPIMDSNSHDAAQAKYRDILSRRDEIKEEIVSRKNRRIGLNRYIRNLKEAETMVTEFSPDLFIGLVDHMIVYSNSTFGVVFRDGSEIKVDK